MVFLEFAVLAGGVALLVATYRSRKKGTPFYPTPATAIREAFHEVGLQPGEKLYDLGAGTGRVLLIAEREFGAKAIGYELSFLFYVIAKINLWFHRSRAELHFGNFLETDLRDADVIFCFLVERALPRVEEKLKRELKPGARIIYYGFAPPTLASPKIIPVRGEWKLFILKQQKTAL